MLVARRLLVALAALMALMAVVVALAPPPPQAPVRETDARGSAPPAAPSEVVEARLQVREDAEPALISAELGDTVRLEIHGTGYDGVEVEGLDLFAALDPDAPAIFEWLADRTGSFPIVLTESDREIGRLEVTRP